MAITPLDIQQQRFRTRFGGGLDKTEVDAFLNAVASEVERLIRENKWDPLESTCRHASLSIL